MKKFASYFIYTILMACIACACSDDLDINQSYPFSIEHLPVTKKLKVGETAEIRCLLMRSGNYKNTKYYIRYYQADGKGELKLDDSRVLLPNDSYELTKESFRLYYTSASEDQQVIDLYFFDNMGQKFDLSLRFNNDNKEKDNGI